MKRKNKNLCVFFCFLSNERMFERKLLCSLCSFSEAGLLNLYSFLSLLLIRIFIWFHIDAVVYDDVIHINLYCILLMRLFLIFTDNENNIYMHFSFWFISTLWNWDLRCGQYAVVLLFIPFLLLHISLWVWWKNQHSIQFMRNQSQRW